MARKPQALPLIFALLIQKVNSVSILINLDPYSSMAFIWLLQCVRHNSIQCALYLQSTMNAWLYCSVVIDYRLCLFCSEHVTRVINGSDRLTGPSWDIRWFCARGSTPIKVFHFFFLLFFLKDRVGSLSIFTTKTTLLLDWWKKDSILR